MRRGLALAVLMLPLSGCYVPPSEAPGYGYAQPGYPPAGYPQPGYSGGGYDPYGYSYNDGAPTMLVEGASVPLILYGGGWGYWDSRHSWHRAPDEVGHRLEQQRASGAGFHPGAGGFGQPRPQGRPPGGGEPNRGSFHGGEQGRPVAASGGAPRPPAASPPPRDLHQRDRGRECPTGQRC
jgi:hypothetical protein